MYQKFFIKRKMDKIIIACDEGIESFLLRLISCSVKIKKEWARLNKNFCLH